MRVRKRGRKSEKDIEIERERERESIKMITTIPHESCMFRYLKSVCAYMCIYKTE